VLSSWINENEAYDNAVSRFVERSLTGPGAPRFLNALLPFAHRVAYAGMLNSLSQLVLKIASPGVADFYQGTERWDLHLVDPDNRRPVDFTVRAAMLEQLRPWLDGVPAPGAAHAAPRTAKERPGPVVTQDEPSAGQRVAAVREMLTNWTDGRIKLFLTALGLRLRRAHADLFLSGDYLPLPAQIAVAGDVVAFARRSGRAVLVVVAPRLVTKLVNLELPIGDVWGTSTIRLSDDLAGRYRNLATGETLAAHKDEAGTSLALSEVLRECPVALLWRE
jgi:(1->4)-alpha-D-glucan 1-alpha-D-glucosylmutase